MSCLGAISYSALRLEPAFVAAPHSGSDKDHPPRLLPSYLLYSLLGVFFCFLVSQ